MAAKASGTKPAAQSRARAAQGPPDAAARAMMGPPPTSAAEAAARGLGPSVPPQPLAAIRRQRPDPDEALDPGVFDFEPVHLPEAADEADEVRIPLFYVGATAYTVPAEPGIEVGLNALHITRKAIEEGFSSQIAESLSMDYVFEVMLGADGYKALRRQRKLDPESFKKVCAIAHRLTIGAIELPKDAENA